MKHYRMTAHESIAWLRICRPGCVIGHQQTWVERLVGKYYMGNSNIIESVTVLSNEFFCPPFFLLSSKQLQMWLQKDEYDNAHNGQSLGIVCPFPVHSLKQRKHFESNSNANYSSRHVGKAAVYLSEICVTGSSLNSVKCPKVTDNGNRINDNAGANSLGESNCRSVICVNSTAEKTEPDSGSVRSILNILDSFKLEDMKDDKNSSASVTAVVNKPGISVADSALLDGPVDPNANTKPEPLKEKKGSVFNEECLVNGMSQGDRLQQIKSLRRHARATTTGALK